MVGNAKAALVLPNDFYKVAEPDVNSDQKYLETLLKPMRVCADYKPKLGQGGKDGYSLREFQQIYQTDPFYN